MKVLTDEFGRPTEVYVKYKVFAQGPCGDIDPDMGEDLFTFEFVRDDYDTDRRYGGDFVVYTTSASYFPERWQHEYPIGTFFDGESVYLVFKRDNGFSRTPVDVVKD